MRPEGHGQVETESQNRSNDCENLIATVSSTTEDPVGPGQTQYISSSEVEMGTDNDSTANLAGSTIAQAVNLMPRSRFVEADDSYSAFEPVGRPTMSKAPTLRPSGRALIKEFFSNTEPYSFSKGHPTVAFTEDQTSCVLKVNADESVRASCDMMEKLIAKTGALSLELSGGVNPRASTGKQTSSKLSFENLEVEKINELPRNTDSASGSYANPLSDPTLFDIDSPGGQTLPSLKAEALNEQSKASRSRGGKATSSPRGPGTRRKITRSCKIMKDAYFKGMEWTLTFVSAQ